MSDTAKNTEQPSTTKSQPQMVIRAQYLKDLSFESKAGPVALVGATEQPRVDLNVNLKSQNLQDKGIEVSLVLRAQSTLKDEPLFLVECEFAAIVGLTEQPEPALLRALLNIEVPRLLFPFARQIAMDAVVHGGFPPLTINPIDFAAAARKAVEQKKEEEAAASPPTGTIQ